ncbi:MULTISPECIES: LysR family transcriptional regulator [Alphaproteobacteria]|uniref:LysR family transcriptional regulator n=2 Tax=Alphaproteobacteria TaxID=28211 RepID=A0A512HIJ7_9HYPH|nr:MULTISPECIES: LysR family transcriptional regulator [Alphaproteobacteria]GEO85278.1 LysR family transcriptional regulator [Ciceribacter naphthalenivorans]GLR20917.1 LysR family transcriptional regulator [Ciceribacter naphthalenivorans]GLT03773.1 LysR family transcriptional regulator [Sphingomonas psychrolutea]
MVGPRRRFVWELDWNLLRTFMVIVQEKGLTAAGDKLSLKQPTISNALRRLEIHMDCRLIERNASHFSVTPAGQRLFSECVALFDIVSGLPQQMEELPGDLTGHIDIALASHVVCPFFDEVLASFHRAFPQVTLAMMVAPSRDVATAVANRDAGFGLCLMEERHQKLEYEVLYREAFGYFCGPRHPLFGRPDIPLSALRDEPYVSFKTDQMTGALWPVALLRQQEEFAGVVLGTSSHLEEVKRLIIAGFGFGPLPIHVVEDDVRAGRLWRLPPYQNAPVIDVHLVYDPTARRGRAESILLAELRQAIGSQPLAERTYPGPASGSV